ncbi:uracil-DNA glycosylase [Beluga whale alphaherpesvirus 1]|uniref:Uracil-DNA glycosylase n=1 Tax=Beluga whale alphaherpesvirus 1 TaxID=1434720 RepID=A0A286RUF9_9ALPH|nr:uracil-DNA glycosylase [Beluga whale alphaherpesvirus 1]ASW27050.1 uracil-DNA glycosylase [Beluga whale alphaherpesvirus 1]
MEDPRSPDAGEATTPTERAPAAGGAKDAPDAASPCLSTVIVISDSEDSDREPDGDAGPASPGDGRDAAPRHTPDEDGASAASAGAPVCGPEGRAPPGESSDPSHPGGEETGAGREEERSAGGENDAAGGFDRPGAGTAGLAPASPPKRPLPRDESQPPPAKRRPAGIPAGVVLASAPTVSGAGTPETEGAAEDAGPESSGAPVTWETLRRYYDVGEAWRPIIEPELSNANVQATFAEYERRLRHETVFPTKTAVFAWTRYSAPENVRVVIVGQDPYHGPGQANGLAFSVKASATVPPSLQNIYAAVARDYPSLPPPAHGSLTAWAKQGVLLLNTSLTVRRGCPGSHASLGWARLVRGVLRRLDATVDHMVFMLWGAHAQKAYSPERPQVHLVLTHSHPSPLARTPFVDCGHFARANAYLTAHGRPPVDWRVE